MARKRHHVPRERTGPTCYLAVGDTPQALAAAQGRRIVLSTGRGDVRLGYDEAMALHADLFAATRELLDAELRERTA